MIMQYFEAIGMRCWSCGKDFGAILLQANTVEEMQSRKTDLARLLIDYKTKGVCENCLERKSIELERSELNIDNFGHVEDQR